MDYILSKDLKEYHEKNGISLTDSEVATLIYNSSNSFKVIYESLRELASQTEDMELKTQIQMRIDEEAGKWNAFVTNQRNAIYELRFYDNNVAEYVSEGFFLDFSIAYAVGQRCNAKFRMTKYRIYSDKESVLAEKAEAGYLNSELGECHFCEDGLLWELWCCEYEKKINFAMEKNRFESQYFVLKHPFRKGDIVKNFRTGEIGIVNDMANDKKMEKRRAYFSEFADFSDVAVFVEVLSEGNSFYHEHMLPTELGFCPMEELMEPEKEFLIYASEVVKGEGFLSFFEWLKKGLEIKSKNIV